MSDSSNTKTSNAPISQTILSELNEYQDWIQKFRRREIGDVKMQKIRLQLGTYAQRQDGVQMQRIKIPGGVLTSAQLIALADASERYGSGFLHMTTRQDAQIYYIQLEDCPQMMRDLAAAGITTREACGNTVRNITACYRAGVAADEIFDVTPYCDALFRFLLRNKYNQVMGRKFKIAFEGCSEDHAGMRFHDIGFQAQIRSVNGHKRRGFRVYLGGGLGAVPMLGELYSDFLPVEEMLHLAAALVRVFDRYGERKNRMQARMKFLIKKMTWAKFKEVLEKELVEVKLPAATNDYLKKMMPVRIPAASTPATQSASAPNSSPAYSAWLRDNLVAHAFAGFKGVLVRLRLGDLPAPQAKLLARLASQYSRDQIKVTVDQNLFFPWVSESDLPLLYQELSDLKLADAGAEYLEDTTTCPGADTCRLGITSAKGLGAAISKLTEDTLYEHHGLMKNIRVKISGCPNGCAQHAIAPIGFQGAALSQEGKTIPANELYLGGEMGFDKTSYGERIGKFPSRNCPQVVETLITTYAKEKKTEETFNQCLSRLGKEKIKEILAPLAVIPSFADNPDFYQDWGHDNEKFAIRAGIKGECAGTPIQEKVPVFEESAEKLAQAEALAIHRDFINAQITAVDSIAASARVPLYTLLVDPFTTEQAIWEFENIFVRSGKVSGEWKSLVQKVEDFKSANPDEQSLRKLLDFARNFLAECRRIVAAAAAPSN